MGLPLAQLSASLTGLSGLTGQDAPDQATRSPNLASPLFNSDIYPEGAHLRGHDACRQLRQHIQIRPPVFRCNIGFGLSPSGKICDGLNGPVEAMRMLESCLAAFASRICCSVVNRCPSRCSSLRVISICKCSMPLAPRKSTSASYADRFSSMAVMIEPPPIWPPPNVHTPGVGVGQSAQLVEV